MHLPLPTPAYNAAYSQVWTCCSLAFLLKNKIPPYILFFSMSNCLNSTQFKALLQWHLSHEIFLDCPQAKSNLCLLEHPQLFLCASFTSDQVHHVSHCLIFLMKSQLLEKRVCVWFSPVSTMDTGSGFLVGTQYLRNISSDTSVTGWFPMGAWLMHTSAPWCIYTRL